MAATKDVLKGLIKHLSDEATYFESFKPFDHPDIELDRMRINAIQNLIKENAKLKSEIRALKKGK